MTARGSWVIRRAVRGAIVAHAREERPRECCGLLVGVDRRVEFAVRMENAEASPARYEIDPAAHIGLRRVLRAFTPPLSIVGVYHSHPAGEPTPSASDLALAMYADWLHVIIGLAAKPPGVRAFEIRSGRARAMRVRWR